MNEKWNEPTPVQPTLREINWNNVPIWAWPAPRPERARFDAGVLEQRHENELAVLVAERYKHVPVSAELARELLHGTRRCLRAADIAHGASFARTFMRYRSMVHESEPVTALWGIGCVLSSSGKKNETNGWLSGEGIAAGLRSVIPYSRETLRWPTVRAIRGSRVITMRYA